MDGTGSDEGIVKMASSTASEVSSDDNESWTVICDDEDRLIDEDNNFQQEALEDTSEDTPGNQQDVSDDDKDGDKSGDSDSDSDIETIDKEVKLSAEEGPQSITSDGIPVGNDLSGDQNQYIWSSEDGLEDQMFESVIRAPLKIPDLTSQYPTEELPERFSEIKKGHTYIHQRNQNLNMVLTSILIVFIALTLGLGIGNFLGWSSRIELHVQFAEVQDEKLEELTESLVTCMTGVEGQGGDDQDLDDRVIQQLSEENRRLKEELDVIKDGKEMGVSEELTVILQDRINALLVANAGLEREVMKLRHSVKNFNEDVLERTKFDLEQTKASLNDIAAENAQLKIEIGKARYGSPSPNFNSERIRLDLLESENNELRKQVEEIREENAKHAKRAEELEVRSRLEAEKDMTVKVESAMVAFDSAKANSISDNLDPVDLQAEESSNSTDNLEADEDLTLADDEKENVNDDLNGIHLIREFLENMLNLYGNSTSNIQTVAETLAESDILTDDELDETMVEIIKIDSLAFQLSELYESLIKTWSSTATEVEDKEKEMAQILHSLTSIIKSHLKVLRDSNLRPDTLARNFAFIMAAQVEAGWEKLLGSGRHFYDFASQDLDIFTDLEEPHDSAEESEIESQRTVSNTNEDIDESSESDDIESPEPKSNLRLKGDTELLEDTNNQEEEDLKESKRSEQQIYHYEWKWKQRLSLGDWLFDRARGRKEVRDKRLSSHQRFEKKFKRGFGHREAEETLNNWVFNRASGRKEHRKSGPPEFKETKNKKHRTNIEEESCPKSKKFDHRTPPEKCNKHQFLDFDFKEWSKKMKNKFRYYGDKIKNYGNKMKHYVHSASQQLYSKSFKPRN